MVEDAENVADIERLNREDDGVRCPAAVACAMAEAGHALRARREHRGLTPQALADAAGLSKPFLSKLEGGKRAGSASTLRKLAAALGVPLVAARDHRWSRSGGSLRGRGRSPTRRLLAASSPTARAAERLEDRQGKAGAAHHDLGHTWRLDRSRGPLARPGVC
ncbi:MAG: helix-turn-helix transcriptional regulator [Rubrivivax sp.]